MYKKINSLKDSVNKRPLKQAVSYINLSDKILSEEEHTVLTLGPKYIFGGNFNIKTVIAESKNIIQLVEPSAKDEIRGILRNNINPLDSEPSYTNFIWSARLF